MNFLNALARIPKLVEQYRAKNVEDEQDIPILQENVGGVWKKEDELKALKAEVAALERKIQLTLSPQQEQITEGRNNTETKQVTDERIGLPENPTPVEPDEPFIRDRFPVACPTAVESRESRGVKI